MVQFIKSIIWGLLIAFIPDEWKIALDNYITKTVSNLEHFIGDNLIKNKPVIDKIGSYLFVIIVGLSFFKCYSVVLPCFAIMMILFFVSDSINAYVNIKQKINRLPLLIGKWSSWIAPIIYFIISDSVEILANKGKLQVEPSILFLSYCIALLIILFICIARFLILLLPAFLFYITKRVFHFVLINNYLKLAFGMAIYDSIESWVKSKMNL